MTQKDFLTKLAQIIDRSDLLVISSKTHLSVAGEELEKTVAEFWNGEAGHDFKDSS